MKTSARPCCCVRLDCAVQISKSPFSKGIVLRTAPPVLIGDLVGKRIRWSGKCPRNISAKYTIPATRNFQAVGTFGTDVNQSGGASRWTTLAGVSATFVNTSVNGINVTDSFLRRYWRTGQYVGHSVSHQDQPRPRW